MKYRHIVEGRFLERPNRFIARVRIADRENLPEKGENSGDAEGISEPERVSARGDSGAEGVSEDDGFRVETVHVKNTGRCRELLRRGARVYLEKSDNPGRSTRFDLVAVEKGTRMVNMDSQAPNRAVEEWLLEGGLFPDVTLVRPESVYGNSRFDFYVEAAEDKIFMEVKGVTLEEDGVVRFPDAPSERAVKHVKELVRAGKDGYRVCVMFVIQMENVKYFTPNRDTHPEFAEALCRAAEEGVEILAYDCLVTVEGMRINRPVPVVLEPQEDTPDHPEGNLPEAENINETFRKSSEKSKLEGIPIPLLKWYDENRRVLPWRENPAPYRVWVSEIMLQQTRVEAVKPYFERFMRELPDIAALAEAEEETLLKLWEGLGYYNRVRNLQKAAIQIQREYGGKMPDTFEELQKLAGIGSYTAGAVASIAFHRPVPAVDGNVLRVAARLRRDGRPVTDSKVKRDVERELREIMPEERPGDFNQALMEIGACVCIPNGAPLCARCPLRELCEAHAAGEEQAYPLKQEKKPRKIENKTILVVRDGNKTVIRKRASRGLLAGMYEFPSMQGFHTAEEVAEYLAGRGLKSLHILPLEDARHIFTHKEWHMKGYMVRVDELEPGKQEAFGDGWLYIEPDETKNRYPIPSAFAAYTRYLDIRLGKKDMIPGQIRNYESGGTGK